MKQQIPTHIKEEVIRKWLSGEQRDKIASDISIAAGTVTKIISEWKEEIGIESFLTQIYNLCTSKNIAAEVIVNISQQIVTLNETIPFSQIPEYIQQKIEEKQCLEQEIKTLRETKLSAQSECDEVLRKSSITIDNLHQYMRLRECLREEYGLSIDDDNEDALPKLINVINDLKHSGY